MRESSACRRRPNLPPEHGWDAGAGEFLLPYDDVRKASSPRDAILEFCESVYEAGARLTAWDPGLVIARQPSGWPSA